jgi:hypothetical protein
VRTLKYHLNMDYCTSLSCKLFKLTSYKLWDVSSARIFVMLPSCEWSDVAFARILLCFVMPLSCRSPDVCVPFEVVFAFCFREDRATAILTVLFPFDAICHCFRDGLAPAILTVLFPFDAICHCFSFLK